MTAVDGDMKCSRPDVNIELYCLSMMDVMAGENVVLRAN